MSEQRCGTCKWFTETGVYTPTVCAIAVPVWVPDSRSLQVRIVGRLTDNCPTWQAKP